VRTAQLFETLLCVTLLWLVSTVFTPGDPGSGLSRAVAVAVGALGVFALRRGRVDALNLTTSVVFLALFCLAVGSGLVEQVAAVDVSASLGTLPTAVGFVLFLGGIYVWSTRRVGHDEEWNGSSAARS
jgi:uncharacterized membrane protein YgdD (TMEM256/DUF423 family)